MAREATVNELAKFRNDGQFSQLFLSIPTPATVVAATVATVPTSDDSSVQLTWTITSGTYSDIIPGQTCLVGTSAGACDKGVVRVRKAPTSSILYLSECSEIDWTVGDYLTVVNDFAIWRRDLRVVANTTFYMDWDVVYSDQHANPDPVVIMGSDVVLWLTGATVGVTLDASDSYVVSGSIASYLWTAPGASATSGLTTATPTITYNAAGLYRVGCSVTTAAGKTFTGYRYIHIYSSAAQPITQFTIDSCEGSYDSGGWSCDVTLFAEAQVRDRSRVVLFAKDWYHGIEGSIGPLTSRENIILIGWIVGESIRISSDGDEVTFRVTGPHEWIRRIKGFPAGVEDTDFADNGGGNPNRWTEMNDLTPAKGLWHFLHWRSTATICTDIYLPTADTRQMAQSSAAVGSLWEQLQTLSRQVNLSVPCCDRYGRLYVLQQQQYVPLDERAAIPLIMDLAETDYDELSIERRQLPSIYYAEVSGVYYNNGTALPIGSRSPGSVPRFMGAEELVFSELVMGTQADANELAGLVAGSGAAEIAFVSIPLQMNNRLIDVTPHQTVRLVTFTAAGETYTSLKFIPRVVRLVYDAEIGFLSTSLDCDSEGIQINAIAMTFPGDTEPPPEDKPPEPPKPPIVIIPPTVSNADAVAAIPGDVRTSTDFDVASPTWSTEI